MIDRLRQEWADGSNRFDSPDEQLFGATVEALLVGIAGVTRQGPNLGRIRRVYVHPSHRRRGIGAALMSRVLEVADRHYDELILRTNDPEAAAFYEGLGFVHETIEPQENATHRLRFRHEPPLFSA